MKIKKILFIICLTLSFTFASLYYQQKKAEAIAPWVAYVAVSAVASLTIGMILYLFDNNDVGTRNTVTAIDPVTGAVSFDKAEIGDGAVATIYTTSNGLRWYPVSVQPAPVSPYPWPVRSNSEVPDFQWDDLVANSANWTDVDYVTYIPNYIWRFNRWNHNYIGWKTDEIDGNINDSYAGENFVSAGYIDIVGGLGGKNVIDTGTETIEIYDFIEDVPLLPDCFDGIQNQDETGIDCGGVCLTNFGFDCSVPPVETCFDGIMNQDETGIDFGGVCGTGDPVAPPPGNLIDNNVDGIDDISGLDSGGNVPVAVPGTGDATTYDASLPGNVSEVGETDWSGLITGYLASNPLVLLATESQINVAGATCSLPMTIFGKSMTINFCPLAWMVDLFGSFLLGLMAIRAVFIAMGI